MDLTSITGFFVHISLDWLFLAGVAILAFVDTMRGGSARAVALGLSFPFAYILVDLAPEAQLVGGFASGLTSVLAQGAFAAAILVLCFLLLYRITDSFVSEGGFIQSVAAAFGLAALVGLFWPLITGFAALYQPSAQLMQVFSEPYRFWWLLVALAALAFSRN
jgi:hypothetical protein